MAARRVSHSCGRLGNSDSSAILDVPAEPHLILCLHGVLRLKRAAISIFLASVLALAWTGCGGGGDGGNQQPTTSKLPNRAFVTNNFTSTLQIINATTDTVTPFRIIVGSLPTRVLLAKDKSLMVVYGSASNTLFSVDPTTETVKGSALLLGNSDSFVISEDVKFVYAAVKNALVSGQPNGAIQRFSLTDSSASPTSVPVPGARWIALNHAGNTMLAFSDQANTVTKFDPTATTPTPTAVVGPFDRPIAAFFSADDTKAYILNCGPECGGTTASVTELTLSNGTTRNVPVAAASLGLLDGTTLYVAGTPNDPLGGSSATGTFQVVDTTAMTASTPKVISGGSHTEILSAGGKIWVGASGCGVNKGCLSIYNTSDQSVKINDPTGTASAKGNVTGMSPISGRNVLYVVEGGELRVYDIATGNETTPLALDVVGQAWGVAAIP
jgi:DNA-binding beta-propeller fold protein YncE